MQPHAMKYNPAFLRDEELLDSFVVRQDDFDTTMLTIHENTTPANQHMLLIGPRGSGKTTLARRVAIEINRDPTLQEQWYPLIFSEESYQVTTPGEFWLEAILHLGEQTKEPRWQRKYEEFSAQWQDEDAMRERALGQLLTFADEQGKRLLLIVENLHMLFGDQISDDDAWKLRHTLMNEPRLMLLATATSRFDEIDQADKAMYELFRIHHLRPLDQNACRVFWHTLTKEHLADDRVRPIQILTGGNLRLLMILSTFGARMSLQQLMTDLVQLVDEHTEYFKSHLDALPPIERKIYLSLAELWDPSTARDVAKAARTDVNKASSLLRRLVERGAVVMLDEPGRTKWYQVTERMYNIYYLFRRHGSSTQRVHAVVRFMVKFYEPEQLITVAHRIADEVPATSKSRIETTKPAVMKALQEAERCEKQLLFAEAEQLYRRAIEIDPEHVIAWAKLGILLYEKLGRFAEAENAYRKVISLSPANKVAWMQLCQLMLKKSSDKKTIEELEQLLIQAPEAPSLMNSFAWEIYQANQAFMLKYALSWAKKAVSLDIHNGFYQYTLASIQCRLGDLDGALKSAGQYVLDAPSVRETVDDAVTLFVELSARGVVDQALRLLSESPSAQELEPLVVGMRLFLGEKIKVAEEVREIGLDVAQRIRQRSDELQQ